MGTGNVHLEELNFAWNEIKHLIEDINKKTSALLKEKEHYEQTLENLKVIGVGGGYKYSDVDEKWVKNE